MTRQHVAAFGIAMGCIAGVATAANHTYYHFKDAIPLGLDVTMIAVFDEGGSPAAPGDVLASVGVDASRMSPSTVPGWTYIATTRSMHGARQIDSVVSRLAPEGEFDFASPVFAGRHGHVRVCPERCNRLPNDPEFGQQWGSCGGCSGDLDDNAVVNVKDMLALISVWGDC